MWFLFSIMENKKTLKTCLGKGVIFVFGVFHVVEKPLLREQRKVVLIIFFTIKGRVVFRVFFSCFLCFPTRGFSFNSKKWRSRRMKMTIMLVDYGGLGVSEWFWVWKALTTVLLLWRARLQVEMPWATVLGSRVENSGDRIQNIGLVRYDSVESYPPWHWPCQVRC